MKSSPVMGRLLVSCAGVLVLASGCIRTAPQQPAHSRASLVVEETAATPGSKVTCGDSVCDRQWMAHLLAESRGFGRAATNAVAAPRRCDGRGTGVAGSHAADHHRGHGLRLPGHDHSALHAADSGRRCLPGTIRVGGELRWLACHDICVPQSAHLEAPIRIGSAASIDEAGAAAAPGGCRAFARGRCPPATGLRRQSLPDGFRLTLVTGLATSEPITRAEFFPGEEAQIDNGAPQKWTNHGGKVSLTLKKSEYLQQEPKHLKGILVLNGRDAYLVDAPVHRPVTQRPATQEGNRQR